MIGKKEEAIKNALQTEKDAMNFYHIASANMNNPQAKKVFHTLAEDEKSHAKEFYKLYALIEGEDIIPFDEFMESPPDENSPWIADLRSSLNSDFDERKAMLLAMDKEQQLEKALRQAAEKCEDPEAREVYEENARSTNYHYQVIESEYARLMAMVHETDMDTYVRE